jgi:hypothetical protein
MGYRTKRAKARAATLIGIYPRLGEGEGRMFMFCTVVKLKIACCSHGFRSGAQLQATVNTSYWYKAFVLYMM